MEIRTKNPNDRKSILRFARQFTGSSSILVFFGESLVLLTANRVTTANYIGSSNDGKRLPIQTVRSRSRERGDVSISVARAPRTDS